MNSQSNLEQKKKADITQPNFKIYYNVIVIKTCGSGIKTDIQTNGTEQRAQK